MADLTQAEIAELQRKAHAYDSEQGRLKKTQEDLEAERVKRAELEARLAAQPPAPGATLALDPKAVEVFGTEGVAVLQNMLAPTLAPVLGKLESVSKLFEARATEEAQAKALKAYREALDTKLSGGNLPGFASRIYDGDLASAWSKFEESHPALKAAKLSGDVETPADLVHVFIHQNRELVAGGGYSPTAVPGFTPPVKCEYTDADYMRDKAALQRQLDNCAIDEAEFGKQTAGLYDRYVAAQEKAERAASAYGLV